MASRVSDQSWPQMNDERIQSTSYIQLQPDTSIQYNPWSFENAWSQGLCDCAENCEEACYGIFFYPCFSCHLAWRMNESCWITCCVPCSLAILRTKLRTAFRIDGSYFYDCCAAEFCPCCTALQMAGELRFRKVMR